MSPPRILLDENIPIRLRLWLEGIEVTSAEFAGWKGIRNGELLRRARAAGYTVLITADRRLAFQPRSWAPLACIFVTSQKPARLRPALARIRTACEQAVPGQVITVEV